MSVYAVALFRQWEIGASLCTVSLGMNFYEEKISLSLSYFPALPGVNGEGHKPQGRGEKEGERKRREQEKGKPMTDLAKGKQYEERVLVCQAPRDPSCISSA